MSMTVKITALCLDAFENPEVFDPGRYLITETWYEAWRR